MLVVEYKVLVKIDPILAREKILEVYFQTRRNISKTARTCGVFCNTVKKTLKRFLEEGKEGLRDKSHRLQNHFNKTPPVIEKMVVEIFDQTNYGVRLISGRISKKRHLSFLWHGLENP
ncbi:MAG: leucine zipper domain-containing protein [candidate division WOR-3 bacterium]